jgi:ribosomal protein S6
MEKTESTSEKGAKVYEIGYLLMPSIAEEQLAAEVASIKGMLEKLEATFIAEDFPKLRPLSYTMAKSANGATKQKFDTAYFGWIKFEASPNAAVMMKEGLAKNDKVLRYMIINTVRENTLMSQRVVFSPGTEGEKVKTLGGAEVAVKVDEVELEKTLDKISIE